MLQGGLSSQHISTLMQQQQLLANAAAQQQVSHVQIFVWETFSLGDVLHMLLDQLGLRKNLRIEMVFDWVI